MTSPYDSKSKRFELVRAATDLFYERGYHRTTLADVATRSQVPLGNLHYYFASKQALCEAVIVSHAQELRSQFVSWESQSDDPRQRLKNLITAPLLSTDSIVRFGCPHGSLCQELEKLGSESLLAQAGSKLLTTYTDWARQQFLELGIDEPTASELAEQVIAAIQGTLLLANALHSPTVLEKHLHRVEFWLNSELEQLSTRSLA